MRSLMTAIIRTARSAASWGQLLRPTGHRRSAAAAAALGVLVAAALVLTGVPDVRGQTPSAGSPSLTPFGGMSSISPATVNYPAGWNLISGRAVQGLAAQDITVPLYTYSANGGYQLAAIDPQASPMAGYWAYFAEPTSVMLPTGPLYAARVPLSAGQFTLIGNPGTLPANTGAMNAPYVLYAYDPLSGAYQERHALLIGEGAWAYSADGATLGLVSVPPCQILRPPAALPSNYVPSLITAAPTPVPAVPAALSCYESG